MALYAKYPEKTFSPCPEGLHAAVCVDVVDEGLVESKFGKREQVRLAWQIAEIDPTSGRRFDAIKTYTNSLFRSARLRIDLDSWRGKPLSDDEARAFDLEKLLGVNCLLHVVHAQAQTDGHLYARVAVILPLPKGTPHLIAVNYTRARDRAARTGPTPTPAKTWPATAAPTRAAVEWDTSLPQIAEPPVPSVAERDVDDITYAFGASTDVVTDASDDLEQTN
jgi:hypothetical protein